MYETTTPAEWLAMTSLSTGIFAAASVPYFLLVDCTSVRDFDPRPALARAVESGRFDALLVAVANAKHDAHRAVAAARRVPRDVAATALLMLLALDAPGDTR